MAILTQCSFAFHEGNLHTLEDLTPCLVHLINKFNQDKRKKLKESTGKIFYAQRFFLFDVRSELIPEFLSYVFLCNMPCPKVSSAKR